MSYILDALRKSETERRQGKVPDLGQQVQLIHRPKKRRISPVLWVALALLVNAVVLAVLFWPERISDSGTEPGALETAPEQVPTIAPPPTQIPAASEPPVEVVSQAQPERASEPLAEPVRERPTIITPSLPQKRQAPLYSRDAPGAGAGARVPHLVELPLSFQKSIPDLMFNSHIYATDPYSSRVMINGHYLRQGESFSGITVEEVTEDGVVLSKQGRKFRVGIVRDWVSPR
ncbi:general secretion pathway protein GspB [Marinobacter sp. ANT_B65]|uniref:general secretion pathway protein GspB n=1 Tax=Marinobacter sp. ANT_B65 TaxID=2039467 RepID=UPI000BBE239D|nr:general secretion pathway protein GspB [Marinobacter sp. ANT_B65]PCM45701.1 hypothetical protein CPA50_06930 [Marinobacter sp. ANT_B65]